jgi:DNA-binding MarR family transcriptional regulator
MKKYSKIGYMLKEVQHELRKKMDNALGDLELTTPQYAALVELVRTPGLSNADLARKSFVTAQTMNLIVQNLEKRNIIQRNPSASHGRIINIELTKTGLALLRRANSIIGKIEEEHFSRLSENDLDEMLVLLTKLTIE